MGHMLTTYLGREPDGFVTTVTRCWFKCEELSIDAGDPGRMLGVNSSYVSYENFQNVNFQKW